MFRRKTDIEKIYDTYSRPLFFSAMRILNNYAEAEDAMQESIISYWTSDKKDEIKNLGHWLRSTCIRRTIDIIRKREVAKGYKEVAAEEQSVSYLHDDELCTTEINDNLPGGINSILNRALQKLPDSYRMIVSLKLFEGYDYDEIAEITGLSGSGIRSQFMRGKAKLAMLSEEELRAAGFIQ